MNCWAQSGLWTGLGPPPCVGGPPWLASWSPWRETQKKVQEVHPRNPHVTAVPWCRELTLALPPLRKHCPKGQVMTGTPLRRPAYQEQPPCLVEPPEPVPNPNPRQNWKRFRQVLQITKGPVGTVTRSREPTPASLWPLQGNMQRFEGSGSAQTPLGLRWTQGALPGPPGSLFRRTVSGCTSSDPAPAQVGSQV